MSIEPSNDVEQSEQDDWDKKGYVHVKRRYCPGCRTELRRFHLHAMALPIEQFTIGRLQQVNNVLGWSVRPFGQQSLHELQLLAFMSPCHNCSLISNWDFGVKELDEIMSAEKQPSLIQIAWNYAPDLIQKHLEVAPDWLKPNLQQLLDILLPKKNDPAQSS